MRDGIKDEFVQHDGHVSLHPSTAGEEALPKSNGNGWVAGFRDATSRGYRETREDDVDSR